MMRERKEAAEINRYLASHLRALHTIERKIERKYHAEIRRMADEAASSFEVGGGISLAIALHEDRVIDLINLNSTMAMPDFYRRGIVAIGIDQKRGEQSAVALIIRRWMDEWGLRQAKSIAATSRDRVMAIINKGLEDGAAVAKIARDIRKLGSPGVSAVRARTIAITETHNAALYANEKGAQSTGLELLKKWVSVEDARVRPEHAVVDDQGYIPMDRKYKVGGYLMQRPGDPTAPAHLVINCRCAQIYKPVGFDFD